jgi:hypothetical protein
VPRDSEPERSGDRRKHVHGPRGPADDASAALMGEFDEQRNVGDVLEVGSRGWPTLLAGTETETLVGGDDDERAVIESDRSQTADKSSQQTVNKAELEQMALPVLVDRRLVVRPNLGGAPAGSRPDLVALA